MILAQFPRKKPTPTSARHSRLSAGIYKTPGWEKKAEDRNDINPYLTNGFSHHYHLGESPSVFMGIRCDF